MKDKSIKKVETETKSEAETNKVVGDKNINELDYVLTLKKKLAEANKKIEAYEYQLTQKGDVFSDVVSAFEILIKLQSFIKFSDSSCGETESKKAKKKCCKEDKERKKLEKKLKKQGYSFDKVAELYVELDKANKKIEDYERELKQSGAMEKDFFSLYENLKIKLEILKKTEDYISKRDIALKKIELEVDKYQKKRYEEIDREINSFWFKTERGIEDYKSKRYYEVDEQIKTYKLTTRNEVNAYTITEKSKADKEIEKYKNDQRRNIKKETESYRNAEFAKVDQEVQAYKEDKNSKLNEAIANFETSALKYAQFISDRLAGNNTVLREQLIQEINNCRYSVNAINAIRKICDRAIDLNGFSKLPRELKEIIDYIVDIDKRTGEN